jgi:hypothetical protein
MNIRYLFAYLGKELCAQVPYCNWPAQSIGVLFFIIKVSGKWCGGGRDGLWLWWLLTSNIRQTHIFQPSPDLNFILQHLEGHTLESATGRLLRQ